MDIKDYFVPVELDKPEFSFLPEKDQFCRNINIYTPNNQIQSVAGYDIAIIGIGEDRNSLVKGSAIVPDLVRTQLYQLAKTNSKIKILDLGNLRPGATPQDTYYGIKDVILFLMSNHVLPVCIGGSQDNTVGFTMAFESLSQKYNLLTVDRQFYFDHDANSQINSNNYLNLIFQNKKLFNYTNIGYQSCFVSTEQSDFINNNSYEALRLGIIRDNPKEAEPFLRDADIVSIDMGSLKNADAPGQNNPSPNGLYSEDLCQITRYAGVGESLKVFGVFNINPGNEFATITYSLAAQAIWYLIDGLSFRKNEIPEEKNDSFKKMIVSQKYLDHKLIFYKSNQTERWWVEVPFLNKPGKNLIISCSPEEYQFACHQEIPERWWRFFQKINK
jgi:arginase family enzyme